VDQTIRRASKLVGDLDTNSVEIGRVVDVIQEIADQTNLLALNAAIIANQAGESGRAFGVVANEVRNLAERTAKSTREISRLVIGILGGVQSAVKLVNEGQVQAETGVQLADKAAGSLKEIRLITQRTFTAVESTVGETARLSSQGSQVSQASRQVAEKITELTRLAGEQAALGREVAKQTQDMARDAQAASAKAGAQVKTGRELSDAVLRLTAAIDEIRAAQTVLTRGDKAIAEEVAEVREDARRVIRSADGLTRTIEQLSHEADSLDAEVFRFKLPAPTVGGTLRVGVHRSEMVEESKGLDPLFTIDLQIAELSGALCSTLVRFEDGMLLPELAETWEADATARRFRFHLRKNVLFHDGVRLQAQHVKDHFERMMDPSVGAFDTATFEDIEGARDYFAGKAPRISGIEVLDEGTLDIRLAEPRAFFLRLLALPQASITRREGGRTLGTGPFRLATQDSSGIVFERHAGYFRTGLPLLNKLEVSLHKGRDAALAALREGQVDLVSYLHAEHLKGKGIEESQVVTTSTPSVWFLAFQSKTPPFDDVRVRRAIRAGLDVRALVERFHPGARIARSLTPPGTLEVDRVHEPRVDVALASRLLSEAGQRKLRLVLHSPPDRDSREEDLVLFAPLIEAGLVELEHVVVPEGFWDKVREGRYAVFRSNWIADVADPDNFLHLLLNSKAQSYYGLGYQNALFDQLTDEARVSIDPGQREALYRKAEVLVREDCVLVPLYHERFHAAFRAPVQGLRLHPTPPQVRFEQLWLDGKA
jgi:ABC-type transport system substrate-binding protein